MPLITPFGGAYDDATIGIVSDSAGETTIPLLKADHSIPVPSIGPEYGNRILERWQAKLAGMEEEEKFDGTQSGMFVYQGLAT